ncbi:MAG: dTDP-4-dehydrorhamnose reductase [Acidobacteria bacterium]|nr:dTDP-4-dehydrorhamnose reductase [Acidobacteriota bacterium]
MKILITGANGMVARTMANICEKLGDEVVALDRARLNIADREAVMSVIGGESPDAVLNCAAFTNVDLAEKEEAACYAANADGPENLAMACKESGSALVTISTDYVFGGKKEGFYTEEDTPDPISVYGRSKYEGELRTEAAYPAAVTVRSGWIYGSGGINFLSKIPEMLAENKPFTAIDDVFGTPTNANDLALRLRELALSNASGIFHVANTGDGTTYHGFAAAVCDVIGAERELITKISGAELERPAPRPCNSRLASIRSEKFEPMPHWADSLRNYLASPLVS